MPKTAPQHAPMDQFQQVGDELLIGNQSVRQLAVKAGRTPFYAYDRALLTARVEQLRTQMPPGLSFHYAMKANPMPAVVSHLAGITDGLDVASAGELRVALDTGTDPRHISFAGPGKSAEDLTEAIVAGVTLNLESEGELERALDIGLKTGRRPVVAVRVNPAFELKTSGMKMSGGPKPFGIDEEQVPALLQKLGNLDVEFRGFHIFSGSQNLKPEAIIDAHNKTFELATRLASQAPSSPNLVNIGGGLGIPYFPGEQRLDLSSIAENLGRHLDRAKGALGDAEIVMELGRYLVAEAGVYICEVVDRKQSRGEIYLVTNGGLHHHLAASGNFGQVIRKNYPVCVATRMSCVERESASVVGPLCTPLDILGDRMSLAPAMPGDLIAVFQSGAYGYSASPHQFLGHPVPPQLLV